MTGDSLSSIIAAVSVLSGVLIAQVGSLFHSFFDRNNQRNERLRNKLEELADNIQQTVVWGYNVADLLSPARQRDPSRSKSNEACLYTLATHARRSYVLSLIYFPDLKAEAYNLLQLTNKMYLLSTNFKPSDTDKLMTTSTEFNLAIKRLDKLIVIEATKIT